MKSSQRIGTVLGAVTVSVIPKRTARWFLLTGRGSRLALWAFRDDPIKTLLFLKWRKEQQRG